MRARRKDGNPEVEKLLIENEKFWRDFDGGKRRSADSTYFAWNPGEQMFMFPSVQTDSTIIEQNHSYGVGLEFEEGTVSLL